MGHVHAEITLKNVHDKEAALDGRIKEEEIRSLTVDAMVDTGATRLCINEEMRQKLGLRIIRTRIANVANGMVKSQITEPVELTWKDRLIYCSAGVIPGLKRALLGVIPLEEMDLTVNPVTQELAGAHGDDWIEYAMSPFED